MMSGLPKQAGGALHCLQSVHTKRILLVDDDVAMCELLKELLARAGYGVDAVHDGRDALERVFSDNYTAMVLDLMLPGIQGLDVLRRVRAKTNIPVLILTAQGEDIDRILGLEVGADDYLPKPFNPRELAARLNAILRRANGSTNPPTDSLDYLKHADLVIDPAARTVRCADSVLNLTTAEFDLLRVLLRNAGQVVTREQLAREGLDRTLAPMDRSVDLHISHLRRKLGLFPDGSERIKAIRGVGYMCAYPAARSSVQRSE